MKLYAYLIQYGKMNSNWIKDLSLRASTIKFLGENIGENIHDIGFGNNFMGMAPKA